MLSSFWLLNIKRLMTLKQQRKKTSIILNNKRNQVGSTDEFTRSRPKLDIKQRTKTLTLLEHYHVHLFDVL